MKREYVIMAVASAAATAIAGIIIKAHHILKYRRQLDCMKCRLDDLEEEQAHFDARLDMVESCGVDFDEYLFEEDSEDE